MKNEKIAGSELYIIKCLTMMNYNFNESIAKRGVNFTESFCRTTGNDSYFEIFELGSMDNCDLLVNTSTHRKRHTIIWFKRGCGQLFIDLQLHDFDDNTIFYLKPGQLHRLTAQTNLQGYYISFSTRFTDRSEIFIALSGGVRCDQQQISKTTIGEASINNELQDLVLEMIRECAYSCELGQEVLRGLIGIFMVHLARFSNTKKVQPCNHHDGQLAKQFLQLLNENVQARKMVSDYASELAITANYLNQIMKRNTGLTASHHIQQYTVLEAKRRAMYLGTTMKEIAYYLGFDDLGHFSKFFKKNAGTSFRDYKNQIATS